MKTRIKQTTKIVDGVEVVEYLAQVHVWQDSFTWYPARLRLNWMSEYYSQMGIDEFAAEFGAKGSLERAQNIIDKIFYLKQEEKALEEKYKQEKRSEKVKYLKYP